MGCVFASCFFRFSIRLNFMSQFWHCTFFTFWWTSLRWSRMDAFSVNVFEQNLQEWLSLVSWWTALWMARCLFSLKDLGHSEQMNFLSSMWTADWWRFTSAFLLNVLQQILQEKFFSSVCTNLVWVRRWTLWVNFFSHTPHSNGLSPVWALICDVRVALWRNLFEHVSQLNKSSLVWILSWISTLSFLFDVCWQNLHLKDFGWHAIWWLFKLSLCTNLMLEHKLHKKLGFALSLWWDFMWAFKSPFLRYFF